MGFSAFLFLPGSTGPAGTQSAAGLFLEFIHKSFPPQSETRTDVYTALLHLGHMVRSPGMTTRAIPPAPILRLAPALSKENRHTVSGMPLGKASLPFAVFCSCMWN